MSEVKTWGVTIEDSALAFSTEGIQPGKWLQNTASQVWGAIKKGVQTVVEFGKKYGKEGKNYWLQLHVGTGDCSVSG